ncbi:cache domain-containing protein [Calditrichota bacterium LG25]
MMLKKILVTLKTYRYLLMLYFFVAALLIFNAFFEMRQSKKELMELMENQSEATLHSLILASENLIKNNVQTQMIIEHHMARTLEILYTISNLTDFNPDLLDSIASRAGIAGILFLDPNFTPQTVVGEFKRLTLEQWNQLLDKAFTLQTISGDTVFWQQRLSETDSVQYRIGCEFLPGGEVLLLIGEPKMMGAFSNHINFGRLIRNIAERSPDIIYLALQDSTNIIAAAGHVQFLGNPLNETILKKSEPANPVSFRILDFDSVSVFEASHPFHYQNRQIGLFRLGLSTKALQSINDRIFQRLLVLSAILIGFALLIVTFGFIRQRYDILQKQYAVIETYSSNIIENVSDAIIVFNNRQGIQIFNNAAERLFKQDKNAVLGKPITRLLHSETLDLIVRQNEPVQEIELTIGDVSKIVLISQSHFLDGENTENYIVVIRDITKQKHLEDRMKRQEQLTAVGQLAAGVAHEIRNPLNSISTIVQQLKKDFKPTRDEDVYNELVDIVYTEVKRINQKINEFLRFSRPEPIRPSKFKLSDWLNSIIKQYQPTFEDRQIEFVLQLNWDGEVFWDANQMRGVMSNLIQNAIDAMTERKRLEVCVTKENDKIIIKVTDSGKGIPPEQMDKIFNLYFTTKADGTGIGLSIVQRIVFEHDGMIQVSSERDKGTTFTITLPRTIALDSSQ